VAEALPAFIEPMLAKSGKPFDSPDHLFEIKWDGIRALTFVADGSSRQLSRNNRSLRRRFPWMSFLDKLEDGTVMDGEIVALRDGKPDFELVVSKADANEKSASRVYVVFDLLYQGFQPLMSLPLEERRERLRSTVQRFAQPRLVFSESVFQTGVQFYDSACRRGLEGVVAKRLQSRYIPGRRSDSWTKIKRIQRLYCTVIGFLEKGSNDFKSLILASNGPEGRLCYVGSVGSGFSNALRDRINSYLWNNLRPTPVVSCPLPGRWSEPGLFCTIDYVEKTSRGLLRSPVFKELVE
jgi:ATP-dependent DNA ligase